MFLFIFPVFDQTPELALISTVDVKSRPQSSKRQNKTIPATREINITQQTQQSFMLFHINVISVYL